MCLVYVGQTLYHVHCILQTHIALLKASTQCVDLKDPQQALENIFFSLMFIADFDPVYLVVCYDFFCVLKWYKVYQCQNLVL